MFTEGLLCASQRLRAGDSVAVKQKCIPTSWSIRGVIWPLGGSYFHRMGATAFQIPAKASEKSLRSIYRLGAVPCWFACLFDQSRFGATAAFVPLSMVALSRRDTVRSSE